ncbi:MAG: hypothetical protein CSA47_00720 [Gammaproteobacteria bacterium]|nr:MAG: hypothetical protein CSA47_00720 [Gammaproteobacteria bacterium]
MQQKTLTTAILVALGANLSIATAEDSTDALVLSPVIVTADYNAGVADMVTITDKAIGDAAVNNPRDLIRNIPGVELESRAIDGFAGFRIRGVGGSGSTFRTGQNRIAVNVDGVPLTDTFKTGHAVRVGLPSFATDDLKAVEVIRGPETSISGKSGLAGTMKFVTKDPEDYYDKDAGKHFGGNVRTGYNGANKGFSLGATVAGQMTDQVSAMLSYSHSKSDEMPNYDKEKRYHDNGNILIQFPIFNPATMAERVDDVDITTDNVMGKVVFEPSANHRFTIKGEYGRRNSKSDLSIPQINPLPFLPFPGGGMAFAFAARPQQTYTDENTGKRYALSLRHDFELDTAFADSGYWQAHYQNYKNHRANDLSYGIAFGTTDYKVTGYGAEVNLRKTLSAGNSEHTINYGINMQNQESKVRLFWQSIAPGMFPPNENYQPDTKTRQITAHINDDIALVDDKLHIMPGIELTHYRIDASPTPGYVGTLTDKSDTHFSWRLGATYDINDNHQAFGGYRQGYKVPSFGELNADVPVGHNRIPNPNLKPEKSAGFTLGLRSQGDIGSQTISAFYDTYRDLAIKVDLGPGPGAPSTTVNMDGKVVVYGLEYQGELDLHRTVEALPEGLKLRGSLAYAKGKNKQTNQPYSDVEPLSGSIGLAYDAPSQRWGMALTTNFAKAKKAQDIAAADTNLFPVSGYGVADLTGYFKPTKGLQINAGVYNLFDKKYAKWSSAQYDGIFPQTYNQITEPGRYFGASLKYDF